MPGTFLYDAAAAALDASVTIAFVWDVVAGATSYVLRVGTATGQSNTYNANVGNVLTYSLPVTAGTYYAAVQAQPAGTWAGEQVVTV